LFPRKANAETPDEVESGPWEVPRETEMATSFAFGWPIYFLISQINFSIIAYKSAHMSSRLCGDEDSPYKRNLIIEIT
jgi:hypothetical protein